MIELAIFMDPTKNFDHLDPKLKDTYARVMGTATPAAGQPVGAPVQAPPIGTIPNQNMGPNPGTGPTVNTVPDASTVVAPPSPEMTAPATSSFFSSPSPATTAPAQAPVQAADNLSAPYTQAAPVEPAPMPVIPYSPDGQQAPTVGAMPEPLASPASVAQNTAKEASPLLRVLYIIAAVIFFAIYTIFWIKVFNLPFLF